MKRLILWSLAVLLVLLSGAVVAGLCLVFFYPWDQEVKRLEEYLAQELPLVVELGQPRAAWEDGPVILVDQVRIHGKKQSDYEGLSFTARRISLQPAPVSLLKREFRAVLHVYSPDLSLPGGPGDSDLSEKTETVSGQGIASRTQAPAPVKPGSMSSLVALPVGLSLSGVRTLIHDGNLSLFQEEPPEHPSQHKITQLQADVRFNADHSFECRILDSLVLLTRAGKEGKEPPWELSGRFSGTAAGSTTLAVQGSRVQGDFKADSLELRFQEKDLRPTEPLTLAFELEGKTNQEVFFARAHLSGSGLDVRTKGSVRQQEQHWEIKLQDLEGQIADLTVVQALLPPEVTLSGKLAAFARSAEIRPDEGILPFMRSGSFFINMPSGLGLEGFQAHFSEGRLGLTTAEGLSASLEDLRISLEHPKAEEWSGKIEVANLQTGRQDPLALDPSQRQATTNREAAPPKKTDPGDLHFSGPVSVKWKLSQQRQGPGAIVVMDLTGGRLRYGNLLDKPAKIPMQVGLRAQARANTVHLGRLFLHISGLECNASGLLTNPVDPSLEFRLTSKILPLDNLTKVSPLAREHGLNGALEIKQLQLTGKPGKLKESAVINVRLSGKDFSFNKVSLKGLFAQAVYKDQSLTLSPLVIHPGQGLMEASLALDFSETFRAQGDHQYHGTLKINNVSLDTLVTLVHPESANLTSGNIDANMAWRGSGLDWPTARSNMEARARVFLRDFMLVEREEPSPPLGEETPKGIRGMIRQLVGKDTAAVQASLVAPEEKRLLKNNNASASLKLEQGILSTGNLAATYEGKVFELQGSYDLTTGRLQVDTGKVFFANRMLPFQLYCQTGKEACLPVPDVQEMGSYAAKEVYQGLRTISVGAKDVFKNLIF